MQSILVLVIISLIPFTLSAYLLYLNGLEKTIEYLPKMIFSTFQMMMKDYLQQKLSQNSNGIVILE